LVNKNGNVFAIPVEEIFLFYSGGFHPLHLFIVWLTHFKVLEELIYSSLTTMGLV